MAKIKDCVVIEREYLDSLLKEFNNFLIENGNSKLDRKIINTYIVILNKIINKTKHLEPIIIDAWKQKDTTLHDYLNEKEI